MGVSDWHALGLGSIRALALVYKKTAFQALKDAGIGCWIIFVCRGPTRLAQLCCKKVRGFPDLFSFGIHEDLPVRVLGGF